MCWSMITLASYKLKQPCDIIMTLLPVGGILPAFNFSARILDIKALFEVLKPAKKRMVTHECKTIWLIPKYLVSA